MRRCLRPLVVGALLAGLAACGEAAGAGITVPPVASATPDLSAIQNPLCLIGLGDVATLFQKPVSSVRHVDTGSDYCSYALDAANGGSIHLFLKKEDADAFAAYQNDPSQPPTAIDGIGDDAFFAGGVQATLLLRRGDAYWEVQADGTAMTVTQLRALERVAAALVVRALPPPTPTLSPSASPSPTPAAATPTP